MLDGIEVGTTDGCFVGTHVGKILGTDVGCPDGNIDG